MAEKDVTPQGIEEPENVAEENTAAELPESVGSDDDDDESEKENEPSGPDDLTVCYQR